MPPTLAQASWPECRIVPCSLPSPRCLLNCPQVALVTGSTSLVGASPGCAPLPRRGQPMGEQAVRLQRGAWEPGSSSAGDGVSEERSGSFLTLGNTW